MVKQAISFSFDFVRELDTDTEFALCLCLTVCEKGCRFSVPFPIFHFVGGVVRLCFDTVTRLRQVMFSFTLLSYFASSLEKVRTSCITTLEGRIVFAAKP